MSRRLRYHRNRGYCRRHNRRRTCSRSRTRSGIRSRRQLMNSRKCRNRSVRQNLFVIRMTRPSSLTRIVSRTIIRSTRRMVG